MRPRFRCMECGRTFDEPKRVQESRGEFWGVPCYETMRYCPFCMGDFEENTEEEEEEEEDEEQEEC